MKGTESQEFTPLKLLAARKGVGFGSAVGRAGGTRRRRHFHDPAYRALTARECSVIVAENETKWQALQPRPNEFRFAAADELVSWARREGLRVRGHTLVWQRAGWMPEWVERHDFGAHPRREAERLLTRHISTVCRHFGAEISSYDVVNEAVDPDTGGLRSNVLTQRLGAIKQIDLAFRLAHEHAPHAQLVYNDYMRWDGGSAKHRAGVLRLLGELKARGAPVHALGLQSHLGPWGNAARTAPAARCMRDWSRFLDEVTAMDLDLLITEFDVNDLDQPGDIETRDAGVATLARDYLDVTLAYERLTDILLWGLADDASWLRDPGETPRDDGRQKRPCPYDARLRPKPLRAAIAEALHSTRRSRA